MSPKINALTWSIAPLLLVNLTALAGDARLAEAVKKHDKDAVGILLKQHIDVNTPEADGATALAWAAHWDDQETADLLIRAGADVNAANEFGVTPLWEACNNGSADMVAKLSKAGANPNVILQGSGETALMRCVSTGNADAVKMLLTHGADVNKKENQKGQTALMWALAERHPDAARLLIEHGADIHAKSKGGFTPLLFAARQGDVASARLLIQGGADVNEPAPAGLTPLLVAADSGQEAFSIFLVQKGASVNAADPDGLTALHYALRMGISTLCSIGGGGRYSYSDSYLFRPNMSVLVNVLLENGANPNARIAKGTKLSANQDSGKGDVTELGLAGATPFLLAAASSDVVMMRTLLAKGADPTLRTNDGVTPIMAAAGVGRSAHRDRGKEEQIASIEAIKLIIELGGDVNTASDDGLTAMLGAAFSGANDIVQFLFDHGAKLDVKDKLGQTPLSRADGDLNGLVDYHGRYSHPSTAELIRKLGGGRLAHKVDVASARVEQ